VEKDICVSDTGKSASRHINTVIVAPMTTKDRPYPTRVPCRFQGKTGQIVLDRLRPVDKVRLVKQLGQIGGKTQQAPLAILTEMFSE
jgi:mRNA interferase MazF